MRTLRLIFTAALTASAVLALVCAGPGSATQAGVFPTAGAVVPGVSIGGIQIGMTQAEVRELWGPIYTVCESCGPNLTWLYEYPGGSAALGAAVKFSTAAPTASSQSAAAAAQKVELAAQTKAGVALAAATAAKLRAKTDAAKATSAAAKAIAAAASATAAKDEAIASKDEAAAEAAKAAADKAEAAAGGVSTSSSGTVVAVFTLGAPVGWGDKGEVMMYDPVTNVYNLVGSPGEANCIGYTAMTVKVGSNTMSFYAASGLIYGFALTAPSQSVCQ